MDTIYIIRAWAYLLCKHRNLYNSVQVLVNVVLLNSDPLSNALPRGNAIIKSYINSFYQQNVTLIARNFYSCFFLAQPEILKNQIPLDSVREAISD